ncbi:MAG TPA: hypothetical protein VMT35_07370 [Ignavibacteriaceae bacterium]|nr:hypothetical protein [Ignavibacteriaceae bacterium]
MKIVKKYSHFCLLAGLILIGCDKPAVTELVQDEDEYTVEVMTDNPSDELQSIDSIGVTDNLLQYASVVTLVGLSTSYYNTLLDESSAAQALLFDRNNPIYSPAGDLIGYRTITPGIIRFSDKVARILPYKIKFRKGSLIADTTAGNQYILFSRQKFGDPFEFPYESFISLSYAPIIGRNGGTIDINTPKRINAAVRIKGKIRDKSLSAALEWNKGSNNKIDIIICGKKRSKEITIPLLRFKTEDDGEFIIPSQYLNTIRFNLYDKIIFMLERKLEKKYSFERGDLYTFSKSIHQIVIDIP